MSFRYSLRNRNVENVADISGKLNSTEVDSRKSSDYTSPVRKRARGTAATKNPRKSRASLRECPKTRESANKKRESSNNAEIAPLVCRERMFEQIMQYIDFRMREKSPGCLYIHGVPGTGKTATVKLLLKALESNKTLDRVYLNAMRLTNPNMAYGAIAHDLLGTRVTERNALAMLRDYFSTKNSGRSCLLILDELDFLYNRTQSVFYNLFDWASIPCGNLIIIAIANTMDMPERIMNNKVKSRLGFDRLCFPPYTSSQLTQIISLKLSVNQVFCHETIEYVAKKVAGVCGDLRRALSICKLATRLAKNSKAKKVELEHVADAIAESFSCPLSMGLESLSDNDRSTLKVICMEMKRLRGRGIDLLVSDVLENLPSDHRGLLAIERLEACGLVYGQSSGNNMGENVLKRSLQISLPADEVLEIIGRPRINQSNQ